jgi:hypothetical protein
MLSRILAFVAGAGLISAQYIPTSISPGCQSTLTRIMASPDAACMNPSALLSIEINTPQTSIVDTINNWVTGICSTTACSNDTITAVIAEVTSGCSAELAAVLALTPDSVQQLTQYALTYYPTVRKMACLKNSGSNQLCSTETLNNIQGLLGTLSKDNMPNIMAEVQSMTSIPSNITCTDCIKEAYNILTMEQPDLVSGTGLNSIVNDQCGSNFTDGSVPTEILQVADASSTSNASLRLLPPVLRGTLSGLALTALTVAASGIILLV